MTSTTPAPYPCWRRTNQRDSRWATKGRWELAPRWNLTLWASQKLRERSENRKCPARVSRSEEKESAEWNWNWGPTQPSNCRRAMSRNIGNSRPFGRLPSGSSMERHHLVISTATKLKQQVSIDYLDAILFKHTISRMVSFKCINIYICIYNSLNNKISSGKTNLYNVSYP